VTALVASVFVASLLGSVHCAGMCGGFVCGYAPGSTARAHVAYHGMRLVVYLSLGIVAGAVGAGITQAGQLVSVRHAAALVAGALMVLWGTTTILATRGVRVPWLSAPVAARPALQQLTRRAQGWSPTGRAAAFGSLTALLPCGWLYAFVVTAGGTGSVPRAMLVMAVFWLGSVPALLAVAGGAQQLTARWRAQIPVVTATSIVLMGLLTIGLVLRPREHLAHAATPAVLDKTGQSHAH
jgi:sulfite exporter TauE/SafE